MVEPGRVKEFLGKGVGIALVGASLWMGWGLESGALVGSLVLGVLAYNGVFGAHTPEKQAIQLNETISRLRGLLRLPGSNEEGLPIDPERRGEAVVAALPADGLASDESRSAEKQWRSRFHGIDLGRPSTVGTASRVSRKGPGLHERPGQRNSRHLVGHDPFP